jgi:uncharacterized YccA/Bax inhibitor family protein
MRTANPALNEQVFTRFLAPAGSRTMTLQGTVVKTGVLLALAVATASYAWNVTKSGDPQAAIGWWIGGALGGVVLALITIFKRDWSPVTAPLYALAEGLFLGAISAWYDLAFPQKGIVLLAVVLTFGTLFSLLAAYATRLIRATENFKLGVCAATGGIALVYLATILLGFFGVRIPYIHESGLIGIGFSLFVVVVAALNLVLDFDFIEKGAEAGAPKFLEWYAAFGLMLTLVWLYVEFLKLLAKLNSRRD